MKKCGKCGKVRRNFSFAKNRRRKDGLQTWCRDCKKSNDATYYLSHSSEMKGKIREAKRKRVHTLQDKIYEYLKTHPCIDCGEKDIIVLEFDHLSDKVHSISDMIRRVSSIESVFEEIKKCEVRCANCHRRKTAKLFKYRRVVSSIG